jgi:hypothetical protein|tara:strand:- start:260 stop:670 length:411 start_codon:yes stop_codon:yes gene_type:complete
MSGPKRVPFKNFKELRDEYRRNFIINFMFGAMLGWPIAMKMGRWGQTYQGGVSVVPYQRWVHDWPNVDYARTNRKYFRRYAMITCAITGGLFAKTFTDSNALKNPWYTRPDFKPKAAMVEDDDQTYDAIALKQLQQ